MDSFLRRNIPDRAFVETSDDLETVVGEEFRKLLDERRTT
jgi:hypothetical protein